MNALIDIRYRTETLEIKDFVCRCLDSGVSAWEYQENFSICYIRKGSFIFKVFNDDLEGYTGKFLLNKPGFTHRVKHYHVQPDRCTVISLLPTFYNLIQEQFSKKLNGFLSNPDVHSTIINSTLENEYLHYRLFTHLSHGNPDHLVIECLVMDLINNLLSGNSEYNSNRISDRHKQLYLPVVEESKHFLQENFAENISLEKIAARSCMSPFHFNRVFKQVTAISPYQYLLQFRLQHAEQLLKETSESIAAIGYFSGFNSPDHFSYTFKAKNKLSPMDFRKII